MAQIEGEAADGGDDTVRRGPLGRTLEGALYQRLGGERGPACRIDERRHDRPRDRVEALEPRIDPLGGGLERDEGRPDQQYHEPPTVTTELGAPNSSSRAAGAAGSASHATPSTRKA